MPGSRIGGLKAAATNKARNGKDFYKRIGAIGGRNGHTGGFASDEVGADGLTGPQRAKIAGSKGGKMSKRGPAKTPHLSDEEYTIHKAEELRRLKAEVRALEAEEEW